MDAHLDFGWAVDILNQVISAIFNRNSFFGISIAVGVYSIVFGALSNFLQKSDMFVPPVGSLPPEMPQMSYDGISLVNAASTVEHGTSTSEIPGGIFDEMPATTTKATTTSDFTRNSMASFSKPKPVAISSTPVPEIPKPVPITPPKLNPALVPICKCESGLRQYNADGTVLRGIVHPADVGLCQINQEVHEQKAESMGFNLLTESGNILYANWLYKTEGAVPWKSSASCHGQY